MYSCEAINEYTTGGKTSKPLIIIEKMLDVKSKLQVTAQLFVFFFNFGAVLNYFLHSRLYIAP
ncbi:unnamed protein product [Haemonchus placei]|uniref:Uncharacterized protein n=1 Tax=Haemonchus placei TaxID=6290 RepID=A0A3P7WMT2_HAEPC|nr:unnamed protein product [Haemonchus placei]